MQGLDFMAHSYTYKFLQTLVMSYLPSSVKTEATRNSETLIINYQTTLFLVMAGD
jgi:hypothetical protein